MLERREIVTSILNATVFRPNVRGTTQVLRGDAVLLTRYCYNRVDWTSWSLAVYLDTMQMPTAIHSDWCLEAFHCSSANWTVSIWTSFVRLYLRSPYSRQSPALILALPAKYKIPLPVTRWAVHQICYRLSDHDVTRRKPDYRMDRIYMKTWRLISSLSG